MWYKHISGVVNFLHHSPSSVDLPLYPLILMYLDYSMCMKLIDMLIWTISATEYEKRMVRITMVAGEEAGV